MKGALLSVVICTAVAGASRPAAADDVSFAGKTITMTIGNAAGSGIDLFGRVLGRHLAQHLPGHPYLVVLNQPGAGSLIAYNSWVKKAKADGLSVATGGLTGLNPY